MAAANVADFTSLLWPTLTLTLTAHLSPFTLTPTLTLTLTRRYDVVCPFKSAFDLSQAFPEAEFVVCGQSGHSAGEEEHTSELVMACDRFARKP